MPRRTPKTNAGELLRILLSPTRDTPDRLTPVIEAHPGAVFVVSEKNALFRSLPEDVRVILLHYRRTGEIGRLGRIPTAPPDDAMRDQLEADAEAYWATEAVRTERAQAGQVTSDRLACRRAARRLGAGPDGRPPSPRTIEKQVARHRARMAFQDEMAKRLAWVMAEAADRARRIAEMVPPPKGT